jgi:hypothetical protein
MARPFESSLVNITRRRDETGKVQNKTALLIDFWNRSFGGSIALKQEGDTVVPVDIEPKAALVLVASLIRQLQLKRLLVEADIATIFGHADDSLPEERNPDVDAIWIRAQEIIAE